MEIIIEIAKNCKEWQNHKKINKVLMRKLVSLVLSKFDNLKQVTQVELSILLADNDQLQALNKQFRDKDYPTNVLSFPDMEIDWRKLAEFKPDQDYMYLGDMAFAYNVILSESMQQNKSFEDHFTHLFIHSMLHLIGFDHQEDEEARVMEDMEIDMLSHLSIASPY